jgi:hypothetical protein
MVEQKFVRRWSKTQQVTSANTFCHLSLDSLDGIFVALVADLSLGRAFSVGHKRVLGASKSQHRAEQKKLHCRLTKAELSALASPSMVKGSENGPNFRRITLKNYHPRKIT